MVFSDYFSLSLQRPTTIIIPQLTMKKVYVFLAEGFEDIEAITTIDVLRRGGLSVTTVSITDVAQVLSAHHVCVTADACFAAVDFSDAQLLVLPGGLPGADNLKAHDGLRQLLTNHAAAGLRIGAICAAPIVLGNARLLDGKRATCYPGFEEALGDACHVTDGVVTDGNITTAQGPAFSLPFAYTLLELLTDAETAAQVKTGMLYV